MAPDDIRDAADRDATDGDPASEIGRGVDASPDGRRSGRPATQLRHEVVTYPDGPDRCTIYPPEATGVVRMSTWLTADRDAFVDLAALR